MARHRRIQVEGSGVVEMLPADSGERDQRCQTDRARRQDGFACTRRTALCVNPFGRDLRHSDHLSFIRGRRREAARAVSEGRAAASERVLRGLPPAVCGALSQRLAAAARGRAANALADIRHVSAAIDRRRRVRVCACERALRHRRGRSLFPGRRDRGASDELAGEAATGRGAPARPAAGGRLPCGGIRHAFSVRAVRARRGRDGCRPRCRRVRAFGRSPGRAVRSLAG